MGNKKIKELFEYRKLPYMLKFLPKKARKKTNKQMTKLQVAIYDLDCYLETNWKLKQKKLKKYWKGIHKELKTFGIPKTEYNDYTAHIQRYELHESQLRDGLLPTRLSMEYYYYYKSCDVRLMRKLLHLKNEELNNKHQLSDWRYFDLVTEVNDDIEDVFEDHNTINGNMFLIMLFESGIADTEKAFKIFLKEILAKSNKRLKANNSEANKIICQWTKESVTDTLKLLDKRVRKIEAKGLKPKKLTLNKYLEL